MITALIIGIAGGIGYMAGMALLKGLMKPRDVAPVVDLMPTPAIVAMTPVPTIDWDHFNDMAYSLDSIDKIAVFAETPEEKAGIKALRTECIAELKAFVKAPRA